MKQVLQSLRTGSTEVADVPLPAYGPQQVLIRTSTTLVSAGTERMLVAFGKAGWLEKARQQPDKVRLAIDKIKTDGLMPTLDAIFSKLDQPLPLGYCNVGTIVATGGHVTGFAVGDRVVSNGRHAEFVAVAPTLCAKIPPSVSDDEAVFAVLGSIALQGIRLAQPTLGEVVAVIGLGLVGLMTVQLLHANGCHVIGLDFDHDRLALARSFGAEVVPLAEGADPVPAAVQAARGRGVDAVIIAASTSSNEPVRHAARMCRKRGRIVLVGVAGLELDRSDFYEKELSFQVSCSYGPGRYDPSYEEKGVDYPLAFVRWTEQRNFEAVLDMLATARLDVKPLVSHRFSIDRATDAYELLLEPGKSLGILLGYPPAAPQSAGEKLRRTVLVTAEPAQPSRSSNGRIGFIGAGNYANAVLIPAFKAAGCDLAVVATRNGDSSLHAARKHGFRTATTDLAEVLGDPSIDAVAIATRHESHAALVRRCLDSGKHVFVEKPLAMTHDEVDRVITAWEGHPEQARPLVMVGFNRRFAPHIVRMRDLLAACVGPKAIVITVNAGQIPVSHWAHNADIGGGRILGEGCHFIDLARHLAGTSITDSSIQFMESASRDSAIVSLKFDDGSIASIQYLANGNRGFPKERVEVFAGGRILQLDNFRVLRGFGWPGFSRMSLWRQDKGQKACAAAFLAAVRGRAAPPIPFAELVEVARAAIDLANQAR